MLTSTKSTSITGNSYITVNSENKIIAYMNANISDSGNVNINKTIQDKELFEANKTSVLQDFSDFETLVYSYITTETV